MLLLGIEFQNTPQWDQEKLKRIVALTDRDQKMLWNLWDAYEQSTKK